ncbi:MAG: 2-5 ligase superfamily protein [Frankiales bacterium]|nr:2-5 ligase superfamily protein [Frankiales bacterium]
MSKRVVVLFPVGDPAAVETFRQRWDPLATAVAAHITLAYPFESEESPSALAATLSRVAREVEPFPVQLERVATEDEEYLFLLADIGEASIQVLHDRLYAGPLGALPKPVRFVPHMTVGRTRDPKALREMEWAAREQALSFAGDAVALSVYRIEGGSRVREFDVALGPDCE